MPGEIVSYDADAQTAEIRIMVRHVVRAGDDDAEDAVTEYPNLVDVPIAWPSGKTGGSEPVEYVFHFPIGPGSPVAVYFSEADLGTWRGSGAVSDPAIATRHGLAGAWAVPGLRARPAALSGLPGSAMALGVLGDSPTLIEISPGSVKVGGNEALAIGADVKAHLQAIAAALDTIATAAGATNSYVYATVLGVNPINTTTTKGS